MISDKQLENLPVFPAIAEKLFSLSEAPELEPEELTMVLEQDPALVAKILQLANSPLNALQKKVQHIQQAINMLGMRRVLGVSISTSVIKVMKGKSYPKTFDYDYFFRRALVTGVAAKSIGRGRVINADLEPLFIAGVLQDIGQLVFMLCYQDEYMLRLGDKQRNHSVLSQIEKEYYVDDHAAAGAWLLKKWDLPSRYCLATKFSHVVDRNLHATDFTACVAASSWFAEYWLDSENDRPASKMYGEAVLGNLLDLNHDQMEIVFERMSLELRDVALCFNDQSLFEYNEEKRKAMLKK